MRRIVPFCVAGVVLAGCSGNDAAGGPRVSAPPITGSATAASSPPSASPSAAPTATPTPTATAASTPAATRSPRRTPVPARYAFPVQGCRADYSTSHHDYPASDIFTGKGCAFVAVTSGRVDEVSTVDRWSPANNSGATRGGISVSIVGDDGVRYYGSHLLRLASGIAPGVRVAAGQQLGLIDNTGDARSTPTHVHFGISWPTRRGIWWVRRGEVWPQRYLASWRAGGHLSPAAEVAAVHRQRGDEPPCTAAC